METLHDLKILITRPKHQAKKIANDIRANGGVPIIFPTIEIAPIANDEALSETFKKIDQFDLVIFISPNAVVQSITYILRFWSHWPKKTKIIAIGPGTEDILKNQGLPVDYVPKKNFSSEGLLALSVLQNPTQKKILILKGEEGNPELSDSLAKRKAQVSTLDVYKRQCPKLDKTQIPEQEEVDVILCTSVTGLNNLVNLLQNNWQEPLFNKQLLVISSRIANFAKKLGFVKAPLISDNASNEAILQTLKIYAKKRNLSIRTKN